MNLCQILIRKLFCRELIDIKHLDAASRKIRHVLYIIYMFYILSTCSIYYLEAYYLEAYYLEAYYLEAYYLKAFNLQFPTVYF